MIEWFDGTHVIRIELDSSNSRGLRVSTATAQDHKDKVKITSEFETFVPSQAQWYKDQLELFSQALRVVLGRQR